MKYNFNSYEAQKQIYDLPSIEETEEYIPYSFGGSYLSFGYKKDACDNLDNIIEND
jgi:hypothetical protein